MDMKILEIYRKYEKLCRARCIKPVELTMNGDDMRNEVEIIQEIIDRHYIEVKEFSDSLLILRNESNECSRY